MIYRASIGDCTALLDDEMTDERPTPEHSRDYLRACSDQVIALYQATLGAPTTSDVDED